ETDGTISPRETLKHSITVMIEQLKAIVGFKEKNEETYQNLKDDMKNSEDEEDKASSDKLKTKIEDFNLSIRTSKALTNAGIKTIGGLAKKKEEDLLNLSGIGDKGIQEIKNILNDLGIELK
ncbi:MAG: DNA-directed RNA polymerase subunit alpha, partial [Candidatus Vogelbacteria bacterium]|nr:DNA-directed RNA polymerase subunit alpha [Candidatus Vogelbacteria bacterium]